MATKVTEASLSCSICLRRFRKPRILPCLHSYCEDCLVEYAPRGTERIACPLCGVKVDIPDGDVTKFKLDFRLQSQVEEANRYDKESGITAEVLACSCCQDEAEAMAKCSDCDQILCKFGMKAHENLSVLQLHTVILLNGDEINQAEQIQKPKTHTPADQTPQKYPIEKRAILVSNLPRLEYSLGKIRDRLTIHFQKRSSNGGDVEGVVYPIHGCPQNAVVVFTERQAYESVLRCEQYLEDFQTKVSTKPLPQVFKEFEASVNEFYWNLIPRLEMKSLIDTLSRRFGKDNLKVSGNVLAKVVCTAGQLDELQEAIVKAIGMKHSSGTSYSAIASGIIIKDIPYLTKDLEQLGNELKKHLENEGVSQVESLLCPIRINAEEAIVLFKSTKDRDGYISHSDKCFYGETLRIINLPPIYPKIKAVFEDFFVKIVSQYGVDSFRARIQSACGPDVTIEDTNVKGTSEQIMTATTAVLEIIGLSPDDISQSQLCDAATPTTARKNSISNSSGSKTEAAHDKYTQTPRPTSIGEEVVVTDAIKCFREKANIFPKPRRLRQTAACSDVSTDTTPRGSKSSDQTPKSSMPSVYYPNQRTNIVVLKDDITEQRVDAIVNAANERLDHGGGVAGAISRAAGKQLQSECNRIMWRQPNIPVGNCVETKAYCLPCQYVIHAVGPTYSSGGSPNFFTDLYKTFNNVLTFAEGKHSRSVAIPLISSGNCGGPKEICTNALATAIMDFFSSNERKHLQQIYLVNIDQEATSALQETLSNLFPAHMESPESEMKLPQRTDTSDAIPIKFKTDEGIEVVVAKGDITKGNAEAIVNAANGSISPNEGINHPVMVPDESQRSMKATPRKLFNEPFQPKLTSSSTGSSSTGARSKEGSQEAFSGSTASVSKPASRPTVEKDRCQICKDRKKKLHPLEGCQHVYCLVCIRDNVIPESACQVCGSMYGQIIEPRLFGKMTYFLKKDLSLKGSKTTGVIKIIYSTPSGLQQHGHPRPGVQYTGMTTAAYLPLTAEGYEVLWLLKSAFLAGHIFRIGSAYYNKRRYEQVEMADIPLKTYTSGGVQKNGYPDPNYLHDVRELLVRKGAVLDPETPSDGIK